MHYVLSARGYRFPRYVGEDIKGWIHLASTLDEARVFDEYFDAEEMKEKVDEVHGMEFDIEVIGEVDNRYEIIDWQEDIVEF